MQQLAEVRDLIRAERGNLDDYVLAVWAEVATSPQAVVDELPAYVDAGTKWWIETAVPRGEWQAGFRERISQGV